MQYATPKDAAKTGREMGQREAETYLADGGSPDLLLEAVDDAAIDAYDARRRGDSRSEAFWNAYADALYDAVLEAIDA